MLFKKTIAAIWAASLLLSTAGVSVHRVYCYCTKKAAVSVFIAPEDDCEKMASGLPIACCKKTETPKACCEKPALCPEKKHNCTDRTTAFAKLDAKFTQPDFSSQLPDFQWVAVLGAPSFFEARPDCPASISLPGNKAPPARASGRELRVRLCSYQC